MIIVAERVNATRKAIARAIREHDEAHIRKEIQAQDEAGAHYIDLNAGLGSGDRERESKDLSWLIDLALETTEKKLALDTSDPDVLMRAAQYLGDRRPMLLNSVTGEPERLQALMPLAARLECPVIGLSMSGTGIPTSPDDRLAVCDAILTAAKDAGVPAGNIFLDPLVLPLCSDVAQGGVTLATLQAIKTRYPEARTIMGLSNVSHGLPRRAVINRGFLIAALAYGLDAAICDPTDAGTRQAAAVGELVAGRDRHCRKFTRLVRQGVIA
ncbi:MAG: methyltetrahydrofolate cobalamin methyltransferase [Candidatus Eisenbacteria bacterium]|nr:methyltetrahydrofolate cobalamin methyltransferase [Candidatus Eisenbacteria bacterium]